MSSESILKDHNVAITDIRRSVMNLIIDHDYALSHQDISNQLPENIDRVTLYRTLHTFEDAGLVHKIIDEEGISRFAKCINCNQNEHKDNHAHFHCLECGKIYCLDDPADFDFNLPSGFLLENVSVDLKGYCNRCNG